LRAAWALLGLAALVGPGVSRGIAAAAEIRIGAINPLTGRFATHGTVLQQGIQYAIEEEARGTVAGTPIRLIVRDDESRPERAIAAAEELAARQRVSAIVGGYVDALVGPISEVAERHRLPYLATASLDERLAQRGHRYFFRLASLGAFVRVTVDFLAEALQVRQVALLYSTTPGATQLAQRQREQFLRRGVQVPVFEGFGAGLADFAPLLRKVRDANAEVVLSNAFFADHLVLLRQAREVQIPLKGFVGTFGMEFPGVVKALGPFAEGAFGTTAWMPDLHPPEAAEQSRAFVAGFRRRYGTEPDPLAMHGYAAARALLAALEAAQAKGLPLREALAATDLMTPLGRVRFDERGDPLGYERAVLQILDGRAVVVYPPQRAAAKPVFPAPVERGGPPRSP
jgi:branched-chain amino acid transport system substrate-binding protein